MAIAIRQITAQEKRMVADLVDHYKANQKIFDVMLEQLRNAIHGSPNLMGSVHSTKWRLKDPLHLRDKLERKLRESTEKRKKFSINKENLFNHVNDLAGFRILHLHTQQIIAIDKALREIFDEYRYDLIEGPTARTWDDESREFFNAAGIKPMNSPTLYTSVHYIVRANSRAALTCEIQVRTLAEELWGEVDHSLNYPHKSKSLPCREQIKVLARVTSSCSRLVDAIFATADDHKKARK